MNPFEEKMPRLVAELHAQSALRSYSEEGFAESTKLEHLSSVALAKDEAIKANLRGVGYGG